MATSIFPEEMAGGVEIRDEQGAPTNPPSVEQAYVPAPEYVSTCPLTAIPSDCTARIEPRQLNAIVSELLSFAECLDADGPWDCNSLQNLCAAFQVWVEANIKGPLIVTEPDLIGDGDTTPLTWTGVKLDPVSVTSFAGNGTTATPLALVLIDGGTY